MKSHPAVRRLLVAVSGLALAGAGVLAPTAPVEAATRAEKVEAI